MEQQRLASSFAPGWAGWAVLVGWVAVGGRTTEIFSQLLAGQVILVENDITNNINNIQSYTS